MRTSPNIFGTEAILFRFASGLRQNVNPWLDPNVSEEIPVSIFRIETFTTLKTEAAGSLELLLISRETTRRDRLQDPYRLIFNGNRRLFTRLETAARRRPSLTYVYSSDRKCKELYRQSQYAFLT